MIGPITNPKHASGIVLRWRASLFLSDWRSIIDHQRRRNPFELMRSFNVFAFLFSFSSVHLQEFHANSLPYCHRSCAIVPASKNKIFVQRRPTFGTEAFFMCVCSFQSEIAMPHVVHTECTQST
mmetsp:Transcript_499/g.1277  ORF Transcript_499/g.1277 Transcript_499/m.1277 type:complete len:124 (-) Transcript_499:508-879(-)